MERPVGGPVGEEVAKVASISEDFKENVCRQLA